MFVPNHSYTLFHIDGLDFGRNSRDIRRAVAHECVCAVPTHYIQQEEIAEHTKNELLGKSSINQANGKHYTLTLLANQTLADIIEKYSDEVVFFNMFNDNKMKLWNEMDIRLAESSDDIYESYKTGYNIINHPITNLPMPVRFNRLTPIKAKNISNLSFAYNSYLIDWDTYKLHSLTFSDYNYNNLDDIKTKSHMQVFISVLKNSISAVEIKSFGSYKYFIKDIENEKLLVDTAHRIMATKYNVNEYMSIDTSYTHYMWEYIYKACHNLSSLSRTYRYLQRFVYAIHQAKYTNKNVKAMRYIIIDKYLPLLLPCRIEYVDKPQKFSKLFGEIRAILEHKYNMRFIALTDTTASILNVPKINLEDIVQGLGYSINSLNKLLSKVKKSDYYIFQVGMGGMGSSFLYWVDKLCSLAGITTLCKNYTIFDKDNLEFSNIPRIPFDVSQLFNNINKSQLDYRKSELVELLNNPIHKDNCNEMARYANFNEDIASRLRSNYGTGRGNVIEKFNLSRKVSKKEVQAVFLNCVDGGNFTEVANIFNAYLRDTYNASFKTCSFNYNANGETIYGHLPDEIADDEEVLVSNVSYGSLNLNDYHITNLHGVLRTLEYLAGNVDTHEGYSGKELLDSFHQHKTIKKYLF